MKEDLIGQMPCCGAILSNPPKHHVTCKYYKHDIIHKLQENVHEMKPDEIDLELSKLQQNSVNEIETVKITDAPTKDQSSFRKKLESLINEHGMENGSDTPDFILADYLVDCLKAFDKASRARTNWYMRR